MGTAKPYLSILSLLLFFTFSIYSSSALPHQLSLVVGEASSSKVQISPSLQVVNSPGTKPGTRVLCERVDVHGFPRLKNLNKFFHSLMLKISPSNSTLRRPIVEVCFHRNASRAIGMCPQGEWEKVDKGGSWVRAMSPYAHKFLDIRMAGSSSETLELSIEEGFFLYRVIFLILGVVMLSIASSLSKSLVFYYSSAMAIGIILVILVVLFQGMKLLPTGRKSSLAIFIYSSLVGLGTFLLRYLPGLLHSILMEMGISEDMYYPLAIFLLAFIAFIGAWMGFWAVRSFVLTEDGSVDISTSHFVAWSIRVLAVVLIIQSSLDPLLAAEALISGIIVSSILRRIFRWRFLRQMYKKLFKLARNINRESLVPDLSPFGGSRDKYTVERPEGSKFLSPRPKQFNLASCNSMKGSSRTSRHQLSDSDVYPSTFHTTPERRKLSKDSWEKFTRESTQKAVKELVSSPDFSKWAAANAERITVTPNSTTSTSRQQRRKWFLWS
ncbi:hypothetical protein POPTR_007G005500v4 [Populus trichocarpa]|uniref:Uncharacterized protein n=1 Tax=Populus trichocarpa TaxID=3694 RepID=A0A2K1ZLY2_POPTR|nr:uncharacterized protein LOC18101246 [Populus trichocarpa]PNT26283.1 hypothetical protein POPTR_007G005500v4 [Populus trichocarpa]|eukprot:XP_006380827.2 uncharacterized protein LOC18101246 [Populus trichocarpa]